MSLTCWIKNSTATGTENEVKAFTAVTRMVKLAVKEKGSSSKKRKSTQRHHYNEDASINIEIYAQDVTLPDLHVTVYNSMYIAY